MYCTNCGKKMDDSALFCDRCGTSLYASNKRVMARAKKRKGLYVICSVVCVLLCLGLYYVIKIGSQNETEGDYSAVEEEMFSEIEDEIVNSTDLVVSTETVEGNQIEEAELAKAEECLENFVGCIIASDFSSMWNLIPDGEIRFWESVGYNKDNIANYFNYFTQITGVNQNEVVNILYDEVDKYSREEILVGDIFATADDTEIEYLEKIETIYYFRGVKLMNDEMVQNEELPFIPEDDIQIGYMDGNYYVVNYFLENADYFVVNDIPSILNMYGYKITSPIIVEQDMNSNYGTYVGVLTKRHYEADPNLGGYDYDYYYLDFGQTVELTCDYYADEALGILETEGISLSSDYVPLERYLDEQVTVTGRVIDSGVRGGRMILVDSIQ